MIKTVTVSVPATTANLGPGFDCLGAALTLHNQFQFSLLDSATDETLQIEVSGVEADRVKTDESNLAYQAFIKLYDYLKQPVPPVHIKIRLEVPLARGLGSSATAIVGGLIGANLLAQSPLDQEVVMQLAIAIEGHPDNVVPALIGGCRLATFSPSGDWTISELPWHEDLIPIVAIPNFELSTAEARQVLPTQYSRADAIFNMAHLGLLIRGLETGRVDWLQAALHDRIHQPYRQTLIAGYEAVQAAAVSAGACGLVISGAGPTLLALTKVAYASAVEAAMAQAWTSQGIAVDVRSLRIDTHGAIIHLHE